MQSCGEILTQVIEEVKEKQEIYKKSAEQNEKQDINCLRCGNLIHPKEGQRKIYCQRCGMVIIIPKSKKNNKDEICPLCMDTGIILYRAQIGNILYEFAGRCLCPEGNKYSNIPSIDDCNLAPPLELIKHRNMKILKKGSETKCSI